ncbi:hypothetical protein D9V41_05480 [Aeromicrobium phragmitis]|uniref:TadE-like domain-containing protein n=1 Tax=Aeromicrobium phragmitis TaxID=2478914 RepID=A0A3L8PMB8_9ACTN|nr:TadE/TadG family type IV pilus assembly protein [Aeromicrobium phragmitis]RLV56527.1 hypothetical protein D9V41_05480 [Aeromicrobium phragmitis]
MFGRRRDRGAAVVEFALLVPVFLVLLFGIISYGWMLSFRQAVSQAAAEGARAAAIVADTSVSDADRRSYGWESIDKALTSYGVTCEDGVLKRAGADAGRCAVTVASGEVTVDLSYDYGAHNLLPMPFLPYPSALSYQTSVRTG